MLATVAPLPVFAQDVQQDRDEGLSLVERGMRLFFDGLIQELEPTMDDMAEALKELEPMARQLADLIGDAQYYDAPERLENGDIIIRRKADAPPPPTLPPDLSLPDSKPPDYVGPKGQIDL
ncbi:AAA+ family ATPase [Pseudorhodobacter sp. W20_MBD10_FR17]